jgi:SSS family solute:Na+ symporter
MDTLIHLHAIDWIMIGIYAVTILSVGLFLARKPQSSEGYFLAGRQLTWPFIGASLFAANISAEHIVGLAESGYSGGLAVGGFEWMAVFCLAPLVFLFLPFYIQNKIYTVPEFLEKRFSPGVRLTFSAFMMILSVLTKISISLWAASVVFSKLFGMPKFVVDLATQLNWTPEFTFQIVIIWIIGLFTVLYTMKGGLRVVVYTDAIQTIILLAAAILLTTIGLNQVGGWSGLVTKINNPDMFDMVKPATDPNYPWPGMFVCVFILGSFYWSMDQVLVQRVFAAKSLNEGRLGAIFCGGLKILTPFLLVLPGLICLALYPGLKEANQAYPKMLSELMPAGLLGLTIAGLTAALMGHISATYNSVATLFTRDIYLKINPQADDRRQVLVGRIACFGVFILGAAWAPMVGKFGGIFTYLQTMQCYLMMPFAGIFFLGVFWKRINAKGVYACLATMLVLVPVFIYNAGLQAADKLTKMPGHGFLPGMDHPLLRPWLHASFVVFIFCMIALVVVSGLTTRPAQRQLEGTTVQSLAFFDHEPMPIYKDYRLWFAVIAIVTASLWWSLR